MGKGRLKLACLSAVAVVLLLSILLPVANSVWCRHAIPAGFSDGALSGTFKSDRYFSVTGRFFVALPKEGTACEETCEVDAILYYNLWCAYRPGQVVRTRLTYTRHDRELDGHNLVGQERDRGMPLIKYIGIAGEMTVGCYRAVDPDDSGHWVAK